jgi:hypothetical protein
MTVGGPLPRNGLGLREWVAATCKWPLGQFIPSAEANDRH